MPHLHLTQGLSQSSQGSPLTSHPEGVQGEPSPWCSFPRRNRNFLARRKWGLQYSAPEGGHPLSAPGADIIPRPVGAHPRPRPQAAPLSALWADKPHCPPVAGNKSRAPWARRPRLPQEAALLFRLQAKQTPLPAEGGQQVPRRAGAPLPLTGAGKGDTVVRYRKGCEREEYPPDHLAKREDGS